MKIIITSLLYLSFFTFIASCDKSNTDEESYLIFGSYCGECIGADCVAMFKLTDDSVWEDQNNTYPGPVSEDQFDFVQMSAAKFELVKTFSDQFPESILDETVDQFGCPDCHDQCGYYLQWKDNGEVRSWTIDTELQAVPEYMHDFLNELSTNLTLLQQ